MDRARALLGALLVLVIPLAGCGTFSGFVLPVETRDGTTHHIVIGFGVVSVNRAPDETVTATRATALGAVLSDRPMPKVGLGYSSSVVVTTVPGVDALVEVSQRPWGPLVINTHRVMPQNP